MNTYFFSVLLSSVLFSSSVFGANEIIEFRAGFGLKECTAVEGNFDCRLPFFVPNKVNLELTPYPESPQNAFGKITEIVEKFGKRYTGEIRVNKLQDVSGSRYVFDIALWIEDIGDPATRKIHGLGYISISNMSEMPIAGFYGQDGQVGNVFYTPYFLIGYY